MTPTVERAQLILDMKRYVHDTNTNIVTKQCYMVDVRMCFETYMCSISRVIVEAMQLYLMERSNCGMVAFYKVRVGSVGSSGMHTYLYIYSWCRYAALPLVVGHLGFRLASAHSILWS